MKEEYYFSIIKMPSVRTSSKAEYSKLLRAIADLIDATSNKRIQLALSLDFLGTPDC
jgi:hypothetical protein